MNLTTDSGLWTMSAPELVDAVPVVPADSALAKGDAATAVDLDEVGQPSRPVVFTGGPEGGRAPDLLCFGEIVLHRRTRKEPPR